jgi:hypothetical protein
MFKFMLRFDESRVAHWAARYSYDLDDTRLRTDVRGAVLKRGFLTRPEFLEICAWKTQRSKSKCAKNDRFTIETITRAAFASSDEGLKMDLLRTLVGVEWPTASTLLHFGDIRPYPILDFRALWSLGYLKPPRYTTAFWLGYLQFTRTLADRLATDTRTLDRALWQYSKEKQRKTSERPDQRLHPTAASSRLVGGRG